jgi:ribosome-binding ATPase
VARPPRPAAAATWHLLLSWAPQCDIAVVLGTAMWHCGGCGGAGQVHYKHHRITGTTRPISGHLPEKAAQLWQRVGPRPPGAASNSLPRGTKLAQVSLSIGIVGLPNVGKSTLFNALTRVGALASNYPFATIEPNVGVVGVPDPRLAELAALYDSARVVPASVRFTDIAGLVRGASQGQGLGNQFLAHIRETDAICQVVRVFADPDVTHVDGDVSPERDIETVITELILADLQTLEKALPRLVKETKFAKDPEKAQAVAAAEAAQRLLDSGTALSAGAAAAGIDLHALRELHLLTAKPFLYVFNVDVAELADEDLRKRLTELPVLAGDGPAEAIFLDAKTEADLAELPEDEAAELLAEAGMGEPGLAQLARAGFRALGLQTFLTAGPKETRAWEIRAGATAPEAAGVIHTDFQRGFIKAEVVSYDDLIAAGSLPAARAAGKARIEGKDYVMRDGDVVEFRFNV